MDPPLRSRFQALGKDGHFRCENSKKVLKHNNTGIRGEDMVTSSTSTWGARSPWEVSLLSKFNLSESDDNDVSYVSSFVLRDDSDYSVNFVSSTLSSSSTATVTLSLQGRTLSYPSVSCGSNSQESPSINLTSTQRQCLSRLLHASCVYSHVALIGPSSSGKSEIARAYARILGYHPYTIVSAYKEMTSFDLLYVFFLQLSHSLCLSQLKNIVTRHDNVANNKMMAIAGIEFLTLLLICRISYYLTINLSVSNLLSLSLSLLLLFTN
jgi:hypothetical protein